LRTQPVRRPITDATSGRPDLTDMHDPIKKCASSQNNRPRRQSRSIRKPDTRDAIIVKNKFSNFGL
jgi:hypothetical protein